MQIVKRLKTCKNIHLLLQYKDNICADIKHIYIYIPQRNEDCKKIEYMSQVLQNIPLFVAV